jgi:hypothetical protein
MIDMEGWLNAAIIVSPIVFGVGLWLILLGYSRHKRQKARAAQLRAVTVPTDSSKESLYKELLTLKVGDTIVQGKFEYRIFQFIGQQAGRYLFSVNGGAMRLTVEYTQGGYRVYLWQYLRDIDLSDWRHDTGGFNAQGNFRGGVFNLAGHSNREQIMGDRDDQYVRTVEVALYDATGGLTKLEFSRLGLAPWIMAIGEPMKVKGMRVRQAT